MRFSRSAAAAGLMFLAAGAVSAQSANPVPPEVAAQLESLPPSRFPLRNATLASAIRLLAADARLSYLSPPEADFSDRITSDVTMNPYDLLQLLAQDYNFGIDYHRGLWRFYRINPNELVTKAYHIHYNSLTHVTIQNSDLNSQLAAAAGTSGGAMGGGGGGPHSGLGGSGSIDAKTSRILEDVKKILEIPTSGLGLAELSSQGPGPDAERRPLDAPHIDPIWDADNSTLFVVATRQQHKLIADYLRTVDRPQKLIRISVRFVETARNPTENLGVDWSQTILGSGGPVTIGGPSASGATNTTTGSTSSTGTSATSTSTSQPITKLLNLGQHMPVTMLSVPAMNWTLQAIASDTKSSIVQDPVIFTANNQQVMFKATTEEPIQQGSTTFGSATAATTSSIAYLEVGTEVTVLPSLLPGRGPGDEIIQCNFAINVSSIIGTQIIGGNPYPVTSNRSYSYSVPIPNGRTLAIAGLEQRTRLVTDSKVPLFGDIPVLGYAFKNRSDQVIHTTLIAFITPELIDEPSAADGEVVALPPMRHRQFQGTSSETLHDVDRSLDGLPADIAALGACANSHNKEAVLNRLDRIGVELSLIDVRLGELKLENDRVVAPEAKRVEADRDLLTRARHLVQEVREDSPGTDEA